MDRHQHFHVEDFINDEHFIEWVLSPNSENNAFWQAWLTENIAQTHNVARARAILGSIHIKPLPEQLSAQEVTAISLYFHQHSKPKIKVWRNKAWLSSAAAAIIILSLGLWHWQKPAVKEVNKVAVNGITIQRIVNNGHSSRLIRLSDESLVLLRPNSALDFPSKFVSSNREVTLTGEAFFEIHHDPAHPFLVKANNMVTKVLGTSFDVISSRDGTESSVVVKTGKVQVYRAKQYISKIERLDSIVLLPNQKVVFNLETPRLEKITVKPLMLSPGQADKVFSFTNAPLAEIISKLQQAYGVEITYDQQKLKGYTVTASLAKLPLEEKIRAICKAIDANYEFQDNQIKIY